MKIPILVTGCNKLNKGFTLIELLVSIIIIGLISSIVFINFSVVDSFEKNTNSLKSSFNYLSEESMLSGSMIGWYANNKSAKAFYLTNSGDRIVERNLYLPKSNWDNWENDKKIFISPEGIETIIENEFVPKPYLIFFPDGQNSGGVLNIEFDSELYTIQIDKNGTINDYKKYNSYYKPLVNKLHKIDTNLKWIVPVVKQRNKLYPLKEENEMEFENNNDYVIETVGDLLDKIESKQENYYQKSSSIMD